MLKMTNWSLKRGSCDNFEHILAVTGGVRELVADDTVGCCNTCRFQGICSDQTSNYNKAGKQISLKATTANSSMLRSLASYIYCFFKVKDSMSGLSNHY